MHRAVILEHTPPDAEAHFDWMVEDPSAPPDRCLRTWRTALRPDETASFRAEQIAHHRPIYLSFEGEIPPAAPGGPGRGFARRLAAGVALWESLGADGVTLQIAWREGPTLQYEGRREADGIWRFVVQGLDARREG